MGRSRNVAILVVITVLLLKTTEAEDYEVGGSTGWTSFPPGGASFYSKWASNFTFKVNDTLGKNLLYLKKFIILWEYTDHDHVCSVQLRVWKPQCGGTFESWLWKLWSRQQYQNL